MMEKRQRARRISWTDAEVTKVVSEMVRLRLADPVADTLTLLRLANGSMPSDRQKETIQSLNQFADIVDKFTLAYEFHLNSTNTTVHKPERVVEEREKIVYLPAKQEPPKTPKDFSTAELSAELFIRLFSRADNIVTRLEGLVDRLAQPKTAQAPQISTRDLIPPRPVEPAPVKKEVRNKRITVVGLRNDKTHQLRERCANLPVDITFVSNESAKPCVPPSSDYVLLMVNFIGHSQQEYVSGKFRRNQVYRVPGVLDQAEELIKTLATLKGGTEV